MDPEGAGTPSAPRLSINVDHVATLRQARLGRAPDPVAAAVLAELGGAEGITIHLREDRRHIQDRDLRVLRETVGTRLSLEMAATDEMVAIALETRPDQVTLVPEKRQELTTEGGLDARDNAPVRAAVERLEGEGIPVFLFLDPEAEQADACRAMGATGFEIHTGSYADAPDARAAAAELERIRVMIQAGLAAGRVVHAGHGLDTINVAPVVRLGGVRELSIGHALVGRAVLVGMERAVGELRARIHEAVREAPS